MQWQQHLVKNARHKPRATPAAARARFPEGAGGDSLVVGAADSPPDGLLTVGASEELESQAHCTRLVGTATSRAYLCIEFTCYQRAHRLKVPRDRVLQRKAIHVGRMRTWHGSQAADTHELRVYQPATNFVFGRSVNVFRVWLSGVYQG